MRGRDPLGRARRRRDPRRGRSRRADRGGRCRPRRRDGRRPARLRRHGGHGLRGAATASVAACTRSPTTPGRWRCSSAPGCSATRMPTCSTASSRTDVGIVRPRRCPVASHPTATSTPSARSPLQAAITACAGRAGGLDARRRPDRRRRRPRRPGHRRPALVPRHACGRRCRSALQLVPAGTRVRRPEGPHGTRSHPSSSRPSTASRSEPVLARRRTRLRRHRRQRPARNRRGAVVRPCRADRAARRAAAARHRLRPAAPVRATGVRSPRWAWGASRPIWLRFDEPFGEVGCGARCARRHGSGGDALIRTWVNLRPATGENVLVGIVGGAAAEEFAELDDADAVEAALASLAPYA